VKESRSNKVTIKFQFVFMGPDGLRQKTAQLTCNINTTAYQAQKRAENHARRYCKRKGVQFLYVLNKPAIKIIDPHNHPAIPLPPRAPSSYPRL